MCTGKSKAALCITLTTGNGQCDNAFVKEILNLVLNQGKQRRNHKGYSVRDDGRKLVAQTLATTSGHQHKDILPSHGSIDCFKLILPE